MPSAGSAPEMRLAIGLMSGTSLDGVDAALVRTDGTARLEPVAALTEPYDPAFQEQLRSVLGQSVMGPRMREVEQALTDRHADAVESLLKRAGIDADHVDVIGFHGQTVLHRPEARLTLQIGDAQRLADRLGCRVVNDLRSADVAAGGQGAPLVPLMHQAITADQPRPLAVLNLGGVANVTWIGPENDLVAFDTGPGNALLNDWVSAHLGEPFDRDGQIAARGQADVERLARLLDHPYLSAPAPKSLDRNFFTLEWLEGLSVEDGAATLTAFTAGSIVRAVPLMPSAPQRWLVAGGGRHNHRIMEPLAKALAVPVDPIEAIGWNGDDLEAQAMAYLAVRVLDGRPITLPSTTGCPQPMTGGRISTPQI